MNAVKIASALGDPPPPPTDDHNLAHWQGRIAAAAANGGGLDIFKAALEAARQIVPPDRERLEYAKREIWGAAERHLADAHGLHLLKTIYFGTFPEDAEQDTDGSGINNELDAEDVKFDDSTATDAEIKRLAKLPLITYDHERKAAAERLGISRLSVLDAAVKAARSENGDTKGQGRPIALHEIEPWPGPVDGAALLDAFAATVKKFVVLIDAAAYAVALWCVATHTFDSFFIFPRLTLRSPTPRCGKTTLRDVVAGLVSKPLSVDSILAAALFRTIELARPTLLLDEADTYLGDNEDLRGILNSGHRRDGRFIRCVGDDHEPRAFSTWAPVLLAQIGEPPATVYDRSIVITLRRKKPSEQVEHFRPKAREELYALARQAARWARDNAIRLAQAEPAALNCLNDRANDNWQPLLAVADLAGRDWPQRARKAAENLAESTANDAASDGEMLLADIRWVLDGKPEEREGKTVTEYNPVDKMSSAELADHLAGIEGHPWAEWKAGKPITPTALARQLGQFGILSGTIRLDNGHTLKGYKRKDFQEAFERYPAPQSVTPSQANNDRQCDASQYVTTANPVTLPKTSQPNIDGHCDGVTACVVVDEQEAAWTL
jgi:putative DNA primase/helicase